MPERRRRPPRFDRPPIVEVVCAATFDPVLIQTVHVGKFWHQYQDQFPRFQDAKPVNRIVEDFSGGSDRVTMELLDLPELRRVWLLSQEGDQVVQIQADRFIFNWKRLTPDSLYPSFDNLVRQFEDHLHHFVSFLEAEGLGSVAYRQFELTYVNHLGEELADSSAAAQMASTVLVDHRRDETRKRFLPLPERFSWASTYRLPTDQGRLHVLARSAVHKPTGRSLVRLDITARGMPAGTDTKARTDWFEMAHEWVTQGFVDITDKQLQNESWGRRQ